MASSPWLKALEDLEGPSRSSGGTSRSSSGRSSSAPWIAALEPFAAPAAQVQPEEEKGGNKSLLGKFGDTVGDIASGAGNAVLQGLEFADTGRRAVVAGAMELADGLEVAFDRENADTLGGKVRDTGFSWEDFKRNTLDDDKNVGFGDFVEEGIEMAGLEDTFVDNQWLKRGLGFAGDVFTDPLTFVTAGATTAGKAATTGRRLLFKDDVARNLIGMSDAEKVAATGARNALDADKAIRKIADDVLENGTGALPTQAARVMGAKTGLQFAGLQLPGTQKIGAAVNRGGAGLRRQTIGRIADKVISPDFWPKIERVPGTRAVREKYGNVAALQYVDSLSSATNHSRNFRRTWGSRIEQILQSAPEGTDWTRIRNAIETGNLKSLKAQERGVAHDVANWLEAVRDDFNDIAGADLPKMEDYFPRFITEELREILSQSRRRPGSPSSPLKRRELRKGGKFGGVELVDGSVDEIQSIANTVFQTPVQMFVDDPAQIFRSYVNALARDARNYGFVKGLEDAGLAKYVDVAELKQRAKDVRVGRRRMTSLGREQGRQEAKAESARRRADSLRDFNDTRIQPNARAAREGLAEVQVDIADLDNTSNDLAQAQMALDDEIEQGMRTLDEGVDPDTPADALEAAEGATAARVAAEGQVETADSRIADALSRLEEAGVVRSTGADEAVAAAEGARDDVARQLDEARQGTPVTREVEEVIPGGDGVYGPAAAPAADFAPVLDEIKVLDRRLDELTAQRNAMNEQIKGTREFAKKGKTNKGMLPESEAAPAARTAGLKEAQEQLVRDLEQELAKETNRAAIRELRTEIRQAKDGTHPSLKSMARTGNTAKPEQVAAELEARIAAGERVRDEMTAELRELRKRRDGFLKDIREMARGSEATEQVIRKTVTEVEVPQDRVMQLEAALAEAEAKVAAARALPKEKVPSKVEVEKIRRELKNAKKQLRRWQERLDEAKRVEAQEWNRLNSLETAMKADAEDLAASMRDRMADIEEEIGAIDGEIDAVHEQRMKLQEEAVFLADEAVQAEAAGERTLAQVAKLESLAADAEAAAVAAKDGAFYEAMRLPKQLTQEESGMLLDVWAGNLQRFAMGNKLYGDPDMVRIMDNFMQFQKPEQLNGFLRAMDAFTARWKAQALLSSGYHIRNTQTAVFMNWLAGVNRGIYRKTAAPMAKVLRAGNDPQKIEAALSSIKDPDLQAAFRTWQDWRGALFLDDGMEVAQEMATSGTRRGIAGNKLRKVDPTSLDFKPYEWNQRFAGGVEKTVRTPLFIDGLLKGMSPEDAYQRVVLHHFDYGDLSRIEKKYLKRIIPFYTWTRKNAPVMFNYMLRKPGGFMWYLHAKRNIETGVPIMGDVVPSYFEDEGTIRTPFQTGTGDNKGQFFLAPDLPFLNLNNVAESGNVLGMLNPLIKTPLEATADKQFWSGVPFNNKLAKAPNTWKPIMHVLQVAGGKAGLPKVIEKDGEFFLSDKDAYKIEQALPLLSRMRRLAPSEEKYQERVVTSWLSTMGGFGSFTNGERQQKGEIYRRNMAAQEAQRVQDQIAEAQSNG